VKKIIHNKLALIITNHVKSFLKVYSQKKGLAMKIAKHKGATNSLDEIQKKTPAAMKGILSVLH
jgi:hypothetical protein